MHRRFGLSRGCCSPIVSLTMMMWQLFGLLRKRSPSQEIHPDIRLLYFVIFYGIQLMSRIAHLRPLRASVEQVQHLRRHSLLIECVPLDSTSWPLHYCSWTTSDQIRMLLAQLTQRLSCRLQHRCPLDWIQSPTRKIMAHVADLWCLYTRWHILTAIMRH